MVEKWYLQIALLVWRWLVGGWKWWWKKWNIVDNSNVFNSIFLLH